MRQLLTFVAEIRNQNKKLAIVMKISNKLARETQPSGSRAGEQLTQDVEEVVLYIVCECHVVMSQ